MFCYYSGQIQLLSNQLIQSKSKVVYEAKLLKSLTRNFFFYKIIEI